MRFRRFQLRAEPSENIIKHGRRTKLLNLERYLNAATGSNGSFLGYLAAITPITQTAKIFAIAENELTMTDTEPLVPAASAIFSKTMPKTFVCLIYSQKKVELILKVFVSMISQSNIISNFRICDINQNWKGPLHVVESFKSTAPEILRKCKVNLYAKYSTTPVVECGVPNVS
jgi:hypothetical protein